MFGEVTGIVVSKGLHDSSHLFFSLIGMAPAMGQAWAPGLEYFLGFPYLKQFVKGLTPSQKEVQSIYGKAAWVSIKLCIPCTKTSSCSVSMCFGLT